MTGAREAKRLDVRAWVHVVRLRHLDLCGAHDEALVKLAVQIAGVEMNPGALRALLEGQQGDPPAWWPARLPRMRTTLEVRVDGAAALRVPLAPVDPNRHDWGQGAFQEVLRAGLEGLGTPFRGTVVVAVRRVGEERVLAGRRVYVAVGEVPRSGRSARVRELLADRRYFAGALDGAHRAQSRHSQATANVINASASAIDAMRGANVAPPEFVKESWAKHVPEIVGQLAPMVGPLLAGKMSGRDGGGSAALGGGAMAREFLPQVEGYRFDAWSGRLQSPDWTFADFEHPFPPEKAQQVTGTPPVSVPGESDADEAVSEQDVLRAAPPEAVSTNAIAGVERLITRLGALAQEASGHAREGIQFALERCSAVGGVGGPVQLLAYADGFDDLRRAAEYVEARSEQTWVARAQRALMQEIMLLDGELVGHVGDTFDPELHEAYAQEGTGQTVVRACTTGVVSGERLLRPAVVEVG